MARTIAIWFRCVRVLDLPSVTFEMFASSSSQGGRSANWVSDRNAVCRFSESSLVPGALLKQFQWNWIRWQIHKWTHHWQVEIHTVFDKKFLKNFLCKIYSACYSLLLRSFASFATFSSFVSISSSHSLRRHSSNLIALRIRNYFAHTSGLPRLRIQTVRIIQ